MWMRQDRERLLRFASTTAFCTACELDDEEA